MSASAIKLEKGGDAALLTDAACEGKKFPLEVVITSTSRTPVVVAEAIPSLVLHQGKPITHTCHTRAHLYDIIFGMLAVAQTTGQATIGSIDTKLPRGTKK